jgi:hypothetical protein
MQAWAVLLDLFDKCPDGGRWDSMSFRRATLELMFGDHTSSHRVVFLE